MTKDQAARLKREIVGVQETTLRGNLQGRLPDPCLAVERLAAIMTRLIDMLPTEESNRPTGPKIKKDMSA